MAHVADNSYAPENQASIDQLNHDRFSQADPKRFSGLIVRDRDFRIRIETLGDLMLGIHEQLRLRGILKTLPLLSRAALFLMIEMVEINALENEGRMTARVSLGYLHQQTGRGSEQNDENKKFNKISTGHISRAVRALIDAGIVEVLETGNGITPTLYEIHVPKTLGSLRQNPMSGRKGCASAPPQSAPARTPNNAITRAGATLSVAPARPHIARRRAERGCAGATLPAHTLVPSVVVAVATETEGDAAEPNVWLDSEIASRSGHFQEAIQLLESYGVHRYDAWTILATDPQIRIADENLCEVIKKSKPGGRIQNPGASWRTALRKHHFYGADPVRETVQKHHDRKRDLQPPPDNYEAIGKSMIAGMDAAEIEETKIVLIEHLKRNNDPQNASVLKAMINPKEDIRFWKLLARNRKAVGR